MVNQKIAELLSNIQEATLFDIGIGLGTQVRNILNMCRDNKQLRKLVVVGIEPGAEAQPVLLLRKNPTGYCSIKMNKALMCPLF